jgi:hypothetical protein
MLIRCFAISVVVVRLAHGCSPQRVIGFPHRLYYCIALHLACLLHISRSAGVPGMLRYIDFKRGTILVRVFKTKSAIPQYPLIRFVRGHLYVVEHISRFKICIFTNAYVH